MFSRESGWTVRYISRVEQAIGQFRLGVFSNAFQAGASGPGPRKGAQKPRSTPNRKSPLLSNDQTKYRLKKWWNQGFSIENLLWRFRLRFCISIEMESPGREPVITQWHSSQALRSGGKGQGMNAMVEGARIKKTYSSHVLPFFSFFSYRWCLKTWNTPFHPNILFLKAICLYILIYRVRYVFIHLFTYLIPTFLQLMYLMSLLSLS